MLTYLIMKIRIGSRKSDLAQIQSRLVAAALKSVQPDLEPHFVFKDVGVDLNLNLSLVDAESKGLFTKVSSAIREVCILKIFNPSLGMLP